MTTNTELEAAHAKVPEIARTTSLVEEARRRLRDHPMGTAPDVARNAVINEAVSKFQADGSWPADLGKRCARAFTSALEWESERWARERAKESTEVLAYDVRQTLSADALAHLGTRLDEVLSAALTAAETLGDVRSADEAIKVKNGAVEAWERLQELTVDLTNIRAAQWALLNPGMRPRSIAGDGDTDERRNLRKWRSQGYGEVRGRIDDVPARIREAARTGRYDEADLLWLASAEGAYVPTSYADLQDDVNVADLIDVTAGSDGSFVDYTPRVTPEPQPTPSKVYAHSNMPLIDKSQQRAPKPQPNATMNDPKPFVPTF